SSSAHAQPRAGTPRTAPPRTAAPTIPPPPPIVYPFPPLMTPPAGGLTPRSPDNPAFRPNSPHRRFNGSSGYAPYLFGSGYAEPGAATGATAAPPARATGWLRLAVTPTTAQVLVDGYYVGTVDDVN